MNIKIQKDKKFKIEMKDQSLKTIQAFGETIEGKVSSCAGKNLMVIMQEKNDE